MLLIAEIGQNHNGDMSLAKELIVLAKKSGADIAKFQLYDAKKLFNKEANPWYEYNLQTELKWEQVCELKDFCDQNEIEFMATPFDLERVEWLQKLNVKRFKIASRSINDTELIEAVLRTNKEVIISLGKMPINVFPDFGMYSNIKYLYCISNYPTKLDELCFSKIVFSETVGGYQGFSDHTVGINAAITAIANGSGIIEKHFTNDKNDYGPDHSCSMTPEELVQINIFREDYQKIYK